MEPDTNAGKIHDTGFSINYLFFRYDLYSAYDYVLPARGKVLAKTDIQVSIFSLLLKNIYNLTMAEYPFCRY